MELVHYEAACREIALANSIDEAKDWADKAEALRAYARQAHNTEMEVQVAEIKLRALRRMGELSKALEKAQQGGAGGGAKIPPLGSSKTQQLADAGISTSAAHRAEQIADIPADEFESSLAEHRDSQQPVTQASIAKPHVSNNSGNNEWYTPSVYIEAAREVMGTINLDPASSEIANKTVQADKYYTASDNGLILPWSGNVWLNPPYAQPLIQQFADKVCGCVDSITIEQITCLVNNATETNWFQSMAVRASAVCLPNRRVKFLDPDGNPSGAPLQGQAILYFGGSAEKFNTVFSKFGVVLKHA